MNTPTSRALRKVVPSALVAGLALSATPWATSVASAESQSLSFPVKGGRLSGDGGSDVFGAKLQKVLAVTDGTITDVIAEAPRRGNALVLTDKRGWTYTYTHLNNDRRGTDDGAAPRALTFAEGIREGSRVAQGEHIAYLGDSGTAERGRPHLTLNIRRADGSRVDATDVLTQSQTASRKAASTDARSAPARRAESKPAPSKPASKPAEKVQESAPRRAEARRATQAVTPKAAPRPVVKPAPKPAPVPKATPKAAPTPVARRTTQATPAPARSGGGTPAYLQRIAECESDGNPRALNPSGKYRGKYQFDRPTWASVGGTGDPAAASEAEQDARAAELYRRRGPAPWPECGRR